MRKLQNSELGRISVAEFKNTQKLPVIVILDNIRSLNNIGSVFRTSDAFIIERVILCGITACPPHNDIRKTALGADEAVDWTYSESTVDVVNDLKTNGYIVLAIEQAEHADRLNTFDILNHRKYALVFGNEVKGVQQEVVNVCSGCLEIPQSGTKHSLNVSVSVGIVLWKFYETFKSI